MARQFHRVSAIETFSNLLPIRFIHVFRCLLKNAFLKHDIGLILNELNHVKKVITTVINQSRFGEKCRRNLRFKNLSGSLTIFLVQPHYIATSFMCFLYPFYYAFQK